MDKQTNIALHLAKMMGKLPHVSTDIRWPGRVESAGREWNPRHDRAQWAECIEWAAVNGYGPTLAKRHAFAGLIGTSSDYTQLHNSTEAGVMAATVVAIARALGWGE